MKIIITGFVFLYEKILGVKLKSAIAAQKDPFFGTQILYLVKFCKKML